MWYNVKNRQNLATFWHKHLACALETLLLRSNAFPVSRNFFLEILFSFVGKQNTNYVNVILLLERHYGCQ